MIVCDLIILKKILKIPFLFIQKPDEIVPVIQRVQ